MSKKEKNKEKSPKAKKAVIIIIITVMAMALGVIAYIMYGYIKGKAGYSELKETAFIYPDEDERSPKNGDGSALKEIDFTSLLSRNPDTIGWIEFDGELSNISYPIVSSDLNKEYLHKSFDGGYLYAGTLFSFEDSLEDYFPDNTVVYGHAMNDGSMFGKLKNLENGDFLKANGTFTLWTKEGGIYKYRIFSTYRTQDGSKAYEYDFTLDELYESFLDTVYKSSIVDTGVTREEVGNNACITLSTCTNRSSTERRVVHAYKCETLREPTEEIDYPEYYKEKFGLE